jgi:hypothetical protein
MSVESKVENKVEKVKYRVTNWKEYNKSLKQRGSLELYLSNDALGCWSSIDPSKKEVGRQLYPDSLILAFGLIMVQYNLPYRQAQGFLESIFCMAGIDVCVPDYSTVNRRVRKFDVELDGFKQGKTKRVAIDSTGLKVSGQGEWFAKKHGVQGRRQWMKLHLVCDCDTGHILGCELFPAWIGDDALAEDMLGKVECEEVCADGAYDTWGVLEVISESGAKALIPPRRNAVAQQGDELAPWHIERNQRVLHCDEYGVGDWKSSTNYHYRSLSEMQMYRFKNSFGAKLKHKTLEGMQNEARLKACVLNRFTNLGKCKSVAIKNNMKN